MSHPAANSSSAFKPCRSEMAESSQATRDGVHGVKRTTKAYAESMRERTFRVFDQVEVCIRASQIINVDPNRGGYDGIVFIGHARWGWAEDDPSREAARMTALGEIDRLEPLVRLLFPNTTPRVERVLKDSFSLPRRWMKHKQNDHAIPHTLDAAVALLHERRDDLLTLMASLPVDEWALRLVVDTNALIDEPDLTVYLPELGSRYRVHIPPLTLGELDNLRRSGRTPELREAASRAVKRLKGLRTNGDPIAGVRVRGEVWAEFGFTEPAKNDLPSWLDLDVPDDRFAACCLSLQSKHPGSQVAAATSDINLQTKLAALGIPFIEPPEAG